MEPNVSVAQDPAESSRTMMPREAAWLAWQAMDLSDDIVLLLESDGAGATFDAVIIAANGAFRRASGFTDDQIVGVQAAGLFPDQVQSKVSPRAEMLCSRAGGGTFMLGYHLMPVPEWIPGRFCHVLLGRDITAQLEARRMADSVQRLLAKVFMSVDEAVVIINAAGRILMTNPRIDHLLGYLHNELVGRFSLDLVAPEVRAPIADTIKRQMELGTDQTYVAPLLKADGSQVLTSITSVIVSTEDTKRFRILTLRAHAGAPGRMRSETASRIKLVGLDEVRAAMGERWHAVAERAMATAEAVIKRRLGNQDSYSRVDDTSFLMCFGALSERDASFRAAVIGREIRDRLIGQGNDPDAAFVQSIAAEVRFPDNGETAESARTILLDGLDAQLERLEREARQTLRSALSGVAGELRRISGTRTNETLAMQVGFPQDLERAIVTALAALPPEETKAFDQDGLLLGLAMREVLASMARGDATPVLVNVRFDVFASRQATERYLATCLRIDPRVASRLILLLASLPEGLPKTRQLECINRLRPFCRGIGYHVVELASLATIDLSFSGTPIVSLPARALVDEEPEKLRILLSSLHARRAKVLIRGVASEKDASWFRLFGADMIGMRRLAS
jgi:PAS domain S-box-containing protein